MKLDYEYIHFEELAPKPKTKVWSCKNNKSKEQLGVVKYHPGWRQYCYFPTVQAIYSAGCMDDISAFLNQVNKAHKSKAK